MTQDWPSMTAADLGRGIAAGRIDPVELAEAYLAAIAAHPAGARIYARITPARARGEAAAAAARARAGDRLGPLDGVPISWKDLFDSAGVATEAGSALLAGRTPAADAEVLRRAAAAGLVCLGKTHMTELAFSGLGINPVTATPPNVFGETLVPGGSSSGAAASVAHGLAAAAIGSDTGGSVRVPAAWNGLVGLKTSHGLLPLAGVVPLCASFDTVGPLCRSAEDAALLLAALGGPAPLPPEPVAGRRLVLLETVALEGLRPGVGEAFEAAVGRLAAAGARIERRAAPEVAEAMGLAGTLFAPEAWGTWRATIEAAPELMFPPVLERFRGGAAVAAADYVAGWRRLAELRAAFAARMADADAVLLPSTPNLPPEAAPLLADPARFSAENLLTLRNTRIGNLLGLCALTLPVAGPPGAGLSLMGPGGGDARLVALGRGAEAVLRG